MIVFEESDREVEFREGNARWIATLSDGRTAYDNNREDVSTWSELHDFCYANGIWITKLYAHFRSNYIHLPSGKEGYFFTRSVLGSLMEGSNTYYFLLGYIEDNVVKIQKYRIPEMILVETEERNPVGMERQLISPHYQGLPKVKNESSS
jgi:hypothetical protein